MVSLNGKRLGAVVPGGRLQRVEQRLEALEVLLPESAIALEPVDGLAEGPCVDPARASLRVAAAGDEAGTLQHFEMLGDGRLTDGERLGKLRHRRFPRRQPSQDGAARRIGERGEGRVELRRRITIQFHN